MPGGMGLPKRLVTLSTSCPSASLPTQVTVVPAGITIVLGRYSPPQSQTSLGPGAGITHEDDAGKSGAGVSSGAGAVGMGGGVSRAGSGADTIADTAVAGAVTGLTQALRISNSPTSKAAISGVLRILTSSTPDMLIVAGRLLKSKFIR